MKKLFYILLFWLCSMTAYSQSITWQRLYNGPHNDDDVVYDICMADEENFYVAGNTVHNTIFPGNRIYVLKLNKYGNIIWSKEIIDIDTASGTTIYKIVPSENGCVMTGSSNRAFSVKIDSSGNVVWYKKYSETGSCHLYDIKKTTDKGYIICGQTVGLTRGYVLKIDSLGNREWDKYFSAGIYNDMFTVEEAIGNDGYVLGGVDYQSFQDTNNMYLLKINLSGDSLWQKDYTINGFGLSPKRIIKYNGQYIIGASSVNYLNPRANIGITKIDADGNQLYSKIILSDTTDEFTDFKIIGNNKYVFTSNSSIPASNYLSGMLRITDTLGNVLQMTNFPSPDDSRLFCVQPLLNGDIVVAGDADFDPVSRKIDMYVVRTDSVLNYPPVSIQPVSTEIPQTFHLYQNYPNPFNPETVINYELRNKDHIKLVIYDIAGREISTLVNELKTRGNHSVSFNGNNLASGVYFYKIEAGSFVETKRMVLLK